MFTQGLCVRLGTKLSLIRTVILQTRQSTCYMTVTCTRKRSPLPCDCYIDALTPRTDGSFGSALLMIDVNNDGKPDLVSVREAMLGWLSLTGDVRLKLGQRLR